MTPRRHERSPRAAATADPARPDGPGEVRPAAVCRSTSPGRSRCSTPAWASCTTGRPARTHHENLLRRPQPVRPYPRGWSGSGSWRAVSTRSTPPATASQSRSTSLTTSGSDMSTSDLPGLRWRGHWVVADVHEFVIDPTSVGSAGTRSGARRRNILGRPLWADAPPRHRHARRPQVVAPPVGRANAPAIPDLCRCASWDCGPFLLPATAGYQAMVNRQAIKVPFFA